MDLYSVRTSINSGKSIFELPLRVVYYARVSTDKAEQLNSLENQTFYFEDYIKNVMNWKYAGGYVDEGITGTSVVGRKSFLRMIDDGRAGRFDLIITKEISRFARDTLDSIRFTRELLNSGVGVYFQSDNINTLLPDAELRLTIMASIAQDEVRKLSERLRFGYKRAIERGRVLGQTNIIGYDKTDGVLSVNEEQAAIVRRIFELYNEDRLGVRRIARELEQEGMLSPCTGKMLSPETIKSIITNPKYKGYYCSGKTLSVDYRNNKRLRVSEENWNVYKDERIPSIVSEAVWDRANAIYKTRGKKAKENGQACQSRYVFSGKIICGEHGATYHRHVYKSKKNGAQEVWNCRLYRQKGKKDGCDSPTIYSKELFEILNRIYNSVYNDKDKVVNGLMEIYESLDEKDYSSEIAGLEKEVEKMLVKKDTLLELISEKLISKSEFVERNDAVNKDIEKLSMRIQEYKNEAMTSLADKRNLNSLRKSLEKELATDSVFNAELSNSLLDKIIVRKINGDKRHLQLQIILNIGKSYIAECENNNFISLSEIGISQAQVSRLEKSALKHMRKHM